MKTEMMIGGATVRGDGVGADEAGDGLKSCFCVGEASNWLDTPTVDCAHVLWIRSRIWSHHIHATGKIFDSYWPLLQELIFRSIL